MGKEPDEIRAEIERTRAELGRDVDTLTEKVSPARVVERRVGRVRASLSNTKDTIMGTADSTADTVTAAAATAAGTVTAAPEFAKAKAQGNPFAVGLVAFGAGWLASTLFPSTRLEERAGQQVKEHADAVIEPVKEQLAQVASEMKETLQPQAEQAMESVKQTAAEAAGAVKATAQDATAEVADQAQTSATTVKQKQGSAGG